MKLLFNPISHSIEFHHERSRSQIILNTLSTSVQVLFSDDDNVVVASLEITSLADFTPLETLLLAAKSDAPHELPPISEQDSSLAVTYDSYGDPFEKVALFTFTLNNRHHNIELSSSDIDPFIAHMKTQLSTLTQEECWLKTEDRLPTRFDSLHDSNEHIDCYIFIHGEIKERPWNIHHECWDDREYDDFEYSATAPSHWMLKPSMPHPPSPQFEEEIK